MVPVMIVSPFHLDDEASALQSTAARSGKSVQGWRLRKHAEYQRVYKATRKQFSTSMTWFAFMRTDCAEVTPLGARVGLTAGKVLGKAHERNRIKRRMREVVRQHVGELPPRMDLILHPRRSVMTMDFGKLNGEVLRIFRQARAQSVSGENSRKAGSDSKAVNPSSS